MTEANIDNNTLRSIKKLAADMTKAKLKNAEKEIAHLRSQLADASQVAYKRGEYDARQAFLMDYREFTELAAANKAKDDEIARLRLTNQTNQINQINHLNEEADFAAWIAADLREEQSNGSLIGICVATLLGAAASALSAKVTTPSPLTEIVRLKDNYMEEEYKEQDQITINSKGLANGYESEHKI